MAYGDLTNLADVKAWLQTGQSPFPSTDDLLLQRLITAGSEFIQNWLGRQIAAADWLELRDGTGGQLLAFANIPVNAILSLSIDGLAIPPAAADGTGFGAGYTFTPTELALRGYVFTRRAQNVIVTYTAGYTTTPPGIAQADSTSSSVFGKPASAALSAAPIARRSSALGPSCFFSSCPSAVRF